MGAANFEHEHTAAPAASLRLCATAIEAVNPHALASLTRLQLLVCYADARQLRSAAGQVAALAALSLTHLSLPLEPGWGIRMHAHSAASAACSTLISKATSW